MEHRLTLTYATALPIRHQISNGNGGGFWRGGICGWLFFCALGRTSRGIRELPLIPVQIVASCLTPLATAAGEGSFAVAGGIGAFGLSYSRPSFQLINSPIFPKCSSGIAAFGSPHDWPTTLANIRLVGVFVPTTDSRHCRWFRALPLRFHPRAIGERCRHRLPGVTQTLLLFY